MFSFSNMGLLVLLFLFQLTNLNGNPIMSIDLGSHTMKIAVVARGKSFDIVLNDETKRKTPPVVAFREGRRVFGNVALKLAARQPDMVYQDFVTLIGKDMSHPIVQQYIARYPFHDLQYNDSIGQLQFTHPDGQKFTVEELFAMVFEFAKSLAEKHVGESVKKCVITVSHFSSQTSRHSVLRAASLAGLDVYQLMNFDTAVALNFGVYRSQLFNTTVQHYLFLNMGASSTSFSVVAYKLSKHHEARSNEEVPVMTVKGVGYDMTFGASNFVYILRDHLAAKFNSMHKSKNLDVTKSYRSMALLLEEAERLLKTLSTLEEVNAQVESLMDDLDFHVKVTRTELETLCSNLYTRLKQPFNDAIQMANISIDQLQEVILMGGGSRMPMIRKILQEMSGKTELGQGVNSDEAAALGSVYQAALYSPTIRARRIYVRDVNLFPIGVDFEPVSDGTDTAKSSESGGMVRRTLFTRANPYPQKRAITFNRHSDDFDFFVNYIDIEPEQKVHLGSLNISKVRTVGVAGSVSQHPDDELRGIKAHFFLDHSGLLNLTGVDCLFHRPNDSTTEEPAAESKPATGDAGTMNQNETANTTTANTTEPTAANSTDKPSTPVVVKPKVPRQYSEYIQFISTPLNIPVQSEEMFQESLQLLEHFREVDQYHLEMESAVNKLESLTFEARDKITTDDFVKYATSEEIESLTKMADEYSEWYDEQTAETPKSEYDERIHSLTDLMVPIDHRLHEAEKRPAAFEKLRSAIKQADEFFKSMPVLSETVKNVSEMLNVELALLRPPIPANSTNATEGEEANATQPVEPPKPIIEWREVFTTLETNSFQKDIESAETWMNESLKSLQSASLSSDPTVLVTDIVDKAEHLNRRYTYLNGKMLVRQDELTRYLQVKEALEKAAKNATLNSDKPGNETVPEQQEKTEVPEEAADETEPVREEL